MKIHCAISSLEFNVDYLSISLTSKDIVHPIFYVPQHKLLSFIADFQAGNLTREESYLIYLALLQSTGLIRWRAPVKITAETNSIIYSTYELLTRVIGKINLLSNPAELLPALVIDHDNNDLNNIDEVIQTWEDEINSFKSNYQTIDEVTKIRNRELALEKLIKTPSRDPKQFANILAEWAQNAANFPTFEVTISYLGKEKTIPLNEYWKDIIKRCVKAESIFAIPQKDIQELIEHCEDNLIHGSIYAETLLRHIRGGKDKQNNFLGYDLSKPSETSFVLLEESNNREDAAKLLLIKSAPTSAPREQDYPTRFKYLQAKLAYDMASKVTK